MPSRSRRIGAFLRGLGTAVMVLALSLPAVAAQPQWADTTRLANRRAKTLFVRGLTQSYLEDYAEASVYFEKALELAPQEPALLSALAEAEAGRDNLTSALYYARTAREQAPTQPHYYRSLADLQKRADQPQAAVETYRTLLSTFPDQDDAYLPLARLLREMGRPRAALRAYQTLTDSTNRPPPQAYVEMAQLYEETGITDGLENTLTVLINRRRNVEKHRRRLGRLYLEQERYAEAIPVYERLVREHPEDPQLLSRLQMLYEKTDQDEATSTLWRQFDERNASPDQLLTRARSLYEESRSPRGSTPLDSSTVAPALQLLRQALDQAPDHVPSLDLLGTIQFEMGAYEKAAATVQQAIDENPRSAERWEQAAAAYLASGQLDRTVNVAEEGLLLFPGRASLLHPLARARLRLGEYNAALTRFRDALDALDSSRATKHRRAALEADRARTLERLDRRAAAASAYEAALKLDPNHPKALRHYAFYLVQEKQNLNRALQLAKRGVEARPTHPEALDTLGWVYYKRGALPKAKKYLQKAVATGRAPAVVYDHFGDLHRALGNETRAREYWEEALDRAPNRDSVRKKLRSLPRS